MSIGRALPSTEEMDMILMSDVTADTFESWLY